MSKRALLATFTVAGLALSITSLTLLTRAPEPVSSLQYPMSAAQVVITEPNGDDLVTYQRCAALAHGAAITCLSAQIAEAAAEGRYGAALGIVAAVTKTPGITIGCHGLAHELGTQLHRQRFPLEEIYAIEWYDCALGFPHGAIEAELAQLPAEDLPTLIPVICGPLAERSEYAYNDCFHNAAHVMVDAYPTDVERVLAMCRSFAEGPARQCVNGSVMRFGNLIDAAKINGGDQRSVAIWGDDHRAQLTNVNLLCDGTTGLTRIACIKGLPYVYATLWDRDWGKIHAACTTFTGDDRQTCYRGIPIAVYSTDGGANTPSLLVEACNAGSGKVACAFGAGFSIGGMRIGGDPDTMICGIFTTSMKLSCREGFAYAQQSLTADAAATAARPDDKS